LAASGLVLLLKISSKGFHFITKIDVFDIFIFLFDFGDCVCGCNNFTSCDCWKTPIHPPLGVIWGHWANFTNNVILNLIVVPAT
jgi:hypothetical protein